MSENLHPLQCTHSPALDFHDPSRKYLPLSENIAYVRNEGENVISELIKQKWYNTFIAKAKIRERKITFNTHALNRGKRL